MQQIKRSDHASRQFQSLFKNYFIEITKAEFTDCLIVTGAPERFHMWGCHWQNFGGRLLEVVAYGGSTEAPTTVFLTL